MRPTRLYDLVQDFERTEILRVLEQTNGNITNAGNILGLSRGTLHCKMKKLGIDSFARARRPSKEDGQGDQTGELAHDVRDPAPRGLSA